MFESIRRIAATFFVLGILVATITIIAGFAVNCPSDTSCLGATFTWNDPLLLNRTSTVEELSPGTFLSDLALLNSVLQPISFYVLLVAAVILIVLEMKELHYLKELSLKKKRT